jgi:hypothetical protein
VFPIAGSWSLDHRVTKSKATACAAAGEEEKGLREKVESFPHCWGPRPEAEFAGYARSSLSACTGLSSPLAEEHFRGCQRDRVDLLDLVGDLFQRDANNLTAT